MTTRLMFDRRWIVNWHGPNAPRGTYAFRVAPPAKPANPVLVADQPWESMSNGWGTLLIEDDKTHFTITAREVDRMPYCGTFGVISGVLTVPKDKHECTWEEKTSEDAGRLD